MKMKRFLAAAAVLLFAFSVTAPAFSVGERLKARTSTGTKAAVAKPQLSEAQKANVSKLQTDLKSIQGKSQVTSEMKTQLANDLTAMAEGAKKPSPETVNKLATDLSTATKDKTISATEQAQLANDLYQVMNSANISQAELTAVVADMQTILKASGVTQADLALIKADTNAIILQFKATASQKPLVQKMKEKTGK